MRESDSVNDSCTCSWLIAHHYWPLEPPCQRAHFQRYSILERERSSFWRSLLTSRDERRAMVGSVER